MSLQSICREAIRAHLLTINPNSHLFNRVPRLGLPLSLVNKMLYDVTLDGEESSDDESDDVSGDENDGDATNMNTTDAQTLRHFCAVF